jgi:hypothetical protein
MMCSGKCRWQHAEDFVVLCEYFPEEGLPQSARLTEMWPGTPPWQWCLRLQWPSEPSGTSALAAWTPPPPPPAPLVLLFLILPPARSVFNAF